MKTTLSAHDLELLSAYLDNQLGYPEQTQVAGRLKKDADWQAALQELQTTRMLLRSLPRRRAPRNFTLTPAMAGVQPERRASASYPVWGWVSAFASLLLIIALVVDWAGLLAPPADSVAMGPAAYSAPVLEAGPYPPSPADETLMAESQPAEPDPAGVSLMQAAEETPTPVGTQIPGASLKLLPATPTEEPISTETSDAQLRQQLLTPTLPPAPYPAATDVAGFSASDSYPAPLEETLAPEGGPVTPLRWVELGLALLIVLSAALAWLGYRRQQR